MRRKLVHKFSLLFLIVFLLQFSIALPTQAGTTADEHLDRQIARIMKKYNAVGLSALVVKNNQVIWTKGYGSADLERNIPVGDDTLYRIASISKSVTATALMQLYEQGKFKLDDDISEALGYQVRNPHFPEQKITYKHLFTHTSGLVEEGTDAAAARYSDFLAATRSSNPPSLQEYLQEGGRFYSTEMWATSAPGTTFNYSNLGTGILGTLVEKLSGERFDQYCKTHIFAPLGIQGSFNVDDVADINKLSVLYNSAHVARVDNYQGIKPTPIDYSRYVIGSNGLLFSPAGGLRITATDLSKFMLAHMNGGEYQGVRILQPETVALMHERHWSGTGMYGFYKEKGLNFQITEEFVLGVRMLGHAGEAYGILTDMYFSAEQDFGILFFVNGASDAFGKGVFYAVEEELVDTLYRSLIQSK